MPIKIGFASYGQFTNFINQLRPNFSDDIEFIIYDDLFEHLEDTVRIIETERRVDAFVASGSNGRYLAGFLKEIPLVEVKITGFDLLFAIRKAAKFSRKIGIITFQKRIDYLAALKDVIDAEIHEFVYSDRKEVDSILDTMYMQGIEDVIGSTYILERTELKGMRGHYIWSIDGIRHAIETAVQIVESKIQEAEKAKKLNSILNFCHEGIIVTDRNGIITEFNPSAENILGIKSSDVIGSNVQDTLPNTRLHIVMEKQKAEYNKIQDIGDIKILTNRSPIFNNGKVIGSLSTFQNITTIREAEENIRRNLHKSGFVAKTKIENLIGQSESFKAAKKMAELYAKSKSNILILGESGTGKELFAQSIHNASTRSKNPFIAINCAAMPANILESEIFGYEEGAFTGARKGGKIGVFEMAHRGTIFLDEIGEIPIDIQSRLLRVLEQKEIFRLGGDKIIHVDIRVIAATNKDLWQMIQKGTFREDLFYRLNVLEIILPSLKDRKSDIPLIAEHFMMEFRPELSLKTIRAIANDDYLLNYDWPGNIRELKNVLERFSVLYEEGANIREQIKSVLIVRTDLTSENEEKLMIMEVLDECDGNKSIACRKLGIGRTTLWRKMKDYGLL